MRSLVRGNDHGVISIGTVDIDGVDDGRVRIVTHAHSDHTVGLNKSANISEKIVATPLTLEWLPVIGQRLPRHKLVPLNYGEVIRAGDLTIRFHKAVHIPGTAQVTVEFPDGITLAYTSDFKRPGEGTPILSPDVLVMDAVYGRPSYRREFDDIIDTILADAVRELLATGPVYLYGYHGKIQEVMELLRKEGVDAPYILPYKQYRLAKIAEKYGHVFGDYVLQGTDEAEDIMRDGWFIYFAHVSSKRRLNGVIGNHLFLNGWEFSRPYKRIGRNKWLVAFSDHADFTGLLKYVEESKPRLLLVNTPRSTGGIEFAEYVRKKLGIEALLLP